MQGELDNELLQRWRNKLWWRHFYMVGIYVHLNLLVLVPCNYYYLDNHIEAVIDSSKRCGSV